MPTHLKLDVVVRPKEERDRVATNAAPINCAMHGGLEDIICTAHQSVDELKHSMVTTDSSNAIAGRRD